MKVARNPVILAQLAYVYARAGMKDKAMTILNGLEAEVKQRYVCGFNVACLYAGLGDKEQAYAWLEKAYKARDMSSLADPQWDPIRSDPRFTDLRVRMGLPHDTQVP